MKSKMISLNIEDVEIQFTVSQLRYEKLINDITLSNASEAIRSFVKSCASDKQSMDKMNVAQVNKIYEMLADAAAPLAMYQAEKTNKIIVLTVKEEVEAESGIEEQETVIEFTIDYKRFEKYQNSAAQSNKVLAIKNLLLDTVNADQKDTLKKLMKTHPIDKIASPVIEQMGDAGKISLVA